MCVHIVVGVPNKISHLLWWCPLLFPGCVFVFIFSDFLGIPSSTVGFAPIGTFPLRQIPETTKGVGSQFSPVPGGGRDSHRPSGPVFWSLRPHYAPIGTPAPNTPSQRARVSATISVPRRMRGARIRPQGGLPDGGSPNGESKSSV